MVAGKDRKYKLTYFDTQWRCEPIRLIFHYFDVPFEDERISGEEWEKRKKDAPFEQLPLLELDDGKKVIGETLAIMRFLAKALGDGFIGKTKTDSAKVDMFVYAANDLYLPIYFYRAAKGGNLGFGTLENTKAMFDVSSQRFLRCCEKALKSHGQKYMVQYITWCDILVMYMLFMLESMDEGIFTDESHPVLFKYYVRMREEPTIKDYVEANLPSKIIKGTA